MTYWCVWAKGDCFMIFQTWTYVWNAYILHSIYNPVMHMITCSEFHQALFEMKEMSRHCSFLSFPLILFSLVCLTTLPRFSRTGNLGGW